MEGALCILFFFNRIFSVSCWEFHIPTVTFLETTGHNKYIDLMKSVQAPASVRGGMARKVLSHGPKVGGSNLEAVENCFSL